jgi:hypothetical protein
MYLANCSDVEPIGPKPSSASRCFTSGSASTRRCFLQEGADVGRKVARTPQPVPRHELKTLYARLFDSRNLRRGDGALEAGETQRFDLAGARQRQ